MCGICGFTGAADRSALERMMATLIHRGPDEGGLWEGEGVNLAMRRLAIIDLGSGQQPVFNEDRTIAVVFNGEIYNYVELRAELEAAGHRFRTHHSDTEVIVHLYEEYGEEFPNRLNGMFAIALWDAGQGSLLLVRDHVGIKPLYYAATPGGLVFGSEPKALLAHPAVKRDPDLIALHHFFTFKNVPAPRSAFAGMSQLRPGELLHYGPGGEVATRSWWQLAFKEREEVTEEQAKGEILALLEDSVRLQMRSDVPFAAYLSGGVDSSAVVALMSRLGNQPVKTFTLVYEDNFANKQTDQAFARAVSRMYGTEHHEHLVTYADVPGRIEEILTAFDEPFSGVISTFFLTEAIGRHVKVALSGDGADELFGSYLPHRLAQPLAAALANPDLLDAQGEEADRLLAPFADQRDFLRRIIARGDEAERRMGQYLADDATKAALYTPAMAQAVAGHASRDLVARELAASGTRDPLNRMLHLDARTLLPDQVLAFVDRLSMAHSVEVRPPFLDPRMVQYAATLPGRLKIRDGRVKHILKEAVAGLLPEGITQRPKEGFIMPINEWIILRLEAFVRDTLSPNALARHGLLREEVVSGMIRDHYAGRENHGNRIWNMMTFQLWWDRHIHGTA